MFKLSKNLTCHIEGPQTAGRSCKIVQNPTMNAPAKEMLVVSCGDTTVSFPMCNICQEPFANNSILKQHMKVHTKEKDFICGVCEKAFTTKRSLKRHLEIHMRIQEADDENDESKSSSAESLVSGSQTSSQTSSKTTSHLNSHATSLVTQHFKKVHECDMCERRFCNKKQLVIHKRQHGSACGQKVFTCEQCGKLFNHKTDLEFHTKVHSTEYPYSCSECKVLFRSKTVLEYHQKTAHQELGQSSEVTKCRLCMGLFANKATLQAHLERKHKVLSDRPEHIMVRCKITQPEHIERAKAEKAQIDADTESTAAAGLLMMQERLLEIKETP